MIKSMKNLTLFERCLWGGSVLALILVFRMGTNRDWWTLAASLIGVTALIFVAKGDVLGQILTVVFSLFYAVISYRFRYYGEMITYLGMSAPIALLSTVTWIRNPYAEREVKIRRLKAHHWIWLALATIAATGLFYFVLKACDTSNLLFSTISIATSFSAATLTMLRSPYYAIAYAANDVVLIVLWVLATLSDASFLPMVLCFVIFLVNDLYGFRNWRAMHRRQQTID